VWLFIAALTTPLSTAITAAAILSTAVSTLPILGAAITALAVLAATIAATVSSRLGLVADTEKS